MGVGFHRLIWPALAAQKNGVTVESARNIPFRSRPYPDGRMAVQVDPIDADVLVFQRVSDPKLVSLIPVLQAKGHAVVVDVDDDAATVHGKNAAAGYEDHRTILKACALADLVTVTTPALARRYGSHGRVAVLPNCVPSAIMFMPRMSDGRTVGWGGWIGSHPGDLEITHGGVAQAVQRADARFQVVGPEEGVARALGFPGTAVSGTGPLRNVAGYEYERALGQLDVGIVPLADTRFNEAKSALKGLQYAARGVPFVASPVAEYERLAAEGVGVLAAPRSRNWRARILELLDCEPLRLEVAARGRAYVAKHALYETQAWRWAEAWETAWAHRQSAGRKLVAA
jgi:glycosyltransferase involved in cell wall biosynthesis